MEDIWKQLAVALVCFSLGTFAGLSMKADAQAEGIASERCGVCQKNINTMITNFNVLSRQCKVAVPDYQDLPTFINNGTVRVYAP
jgi:hypothetical protein